MLKRLLILCFLISILSSQVLWSQYRAYPIDDGHSSISFSTYFSKVIKVPGSFGKYWGHVFYDPNDLSKLSASVVIEAASINTNVKFRDAHLKRADFFDVENHPYLTFISDKVVTQGEEHALRGKLQIKGKTLSIDIPFQLIDNVGPDPWGNQRFTLAGNFQLNRNDFGLGEEGEFFHRSINDMIDIQLVMTMAIRNTDRYSLFKQPLAKTIYDLMTEESVAAGLEHYAAQKDQVENKFFHSPQFLNTFAQRLVQYKELDKAIEVYEYNAAQFPEEDGIQANLAHAYYLAKKEKKAQSLAAQVLEKNEFNTLGIELHRLLAKE